jgi:serine/threonine protein kinase
MTDFVGHQLGNYRLISLIGQGGFADVYLGEHIHLNTQAAIKVLQTRLAGSNLEQFRDEARIIASLTHPNIVRVLDFGEEEGTPYLVMEYATDGTLRQRYPKGIPLSPSSILPYVRQTADALQYAHNKKFIHRDIKPENMLLGPANQLLLSDFGLVLVAQSTASQSSREMGGTVPYMAPEQLQGRPRAASDQYSLGVVVYEWLSGDRPFHGTFTEIVSQHMFVPPPPLQVRIPGISPEVEHVVLKALAKDPQQRFANIGAFAAAFEQACRAMQQPPHSSTYSTIPIDQPLVPAYLLSRAQPHVMPSPSQSSQSTIVNGPTARTSVNTPQHQLAQFTNVAQPGHSPTMVATPSNQSSHLVAVHSMLNQASAPVPLYAAPKEGSSAYPRSRRRASKWPIVIAICVVIIAMIASLPLLTGSGTSKSPNANGAGTPLTSNGALPAATQTSLPKPASTAKATRASLPASTSLPTPTPVISTPTSVPVTPPPTPPPPSGPDVASSSFGPNQCAVTSQGWTCTETLSEAQNANGNLQWSASSASAGVTFTQAGGTLSPGKTTQVSIAIPLSDCNDTFTFKGPTSKANVTWNCTLSTPVQLSPANGTVFNNYPRTTTLQWSAVPGAASYTVQVYYYQPGDTTCTGGAPDYLTPNITGTSYTFDFVGAQPGCWRVWAVDAAGRQSPMSGWWEFSYTI